MRYLIVNADDLGLSPEINAGICEGLDRGVITDTSLMVRAGQAPQAARELKRRGITSLGLHLDLDARLGWSSPGRERYPRARLTELLESPAFVAGLYREAHRQMEGFLALGLNPTHIDTHHHVHGFPAIFRIMVQLMREYGVRSLRFSRTGYSLPTREDIPLTAADYRETDACLRNYGFFRTGCMLEGAQRLSQLSAHSTELVVHPARGGEEWRNRELAFLLGAEFSDMLRRQECTLVSFAAFS